MEKRKKTKRGRPVGSKNKKMFQCDMIAKYFANMCISSYGIDHAEQLAVKILEKIRANKARLNEKYQPHLHHKAGGSNSSSGCSLPISKR